MVGQLEPLFLFFRPPMEAKTTGFQDSKEDEKIRN